ncbi:hypothetical protein E2C01_099278 [Portunus trituberculatus]|uniref:Uncharacterized protein n=1 Tax=Portunus trituberculatus TaxID=210409 RepID=A0A5B7KAK4_PORTR|nr:hypothetical protein [Portunus trituberculatus]
MCIPRAVTHLEHNPFTSPRPLMPGRARRGEAQVCVTNLLRYSLYLISLYA